MYRSVLRLLLEGKNDVQTLSNATGIPRQKILEILPELQEMLANIYEPEEEDSYRQNWWQRWWRQKK